MRRFKVYAETSKVGSEVFDFVEVDDDATDDDIEEECRDCAMNLIEWVYEEIAEES